MSIIRPSVGTPSLFLTFVFCRGTVLLYGDTPRSVTPCKRLTDWQLLKAADYSTCDQHQRACMTDDNASSCVQLSDWKVKKAKVKNHKPLWRHCSRTQNVCKSDLQTGFHFWHHKVHRAVSGSHAACQRFLTHLAKKFHSFFSLSLTAKIQCKKITVTVVQCTIHCFHYPLHLQASGLCLQGWSKPWPHYGTGNVEYLQAVS